MQSGRGQSQHIGDGLAKGGISIVKGLWDGVSGLMAQLAKDLKKGGVGIAFGRAWQAW